MNAVDYLKLSKKEKKTKLELELLKSEKTLRTISEIVTDATKREISNDSAIESIRQILNNND